MLAREKRWRFESKELRVDEQRVIWCHASVVDSNLDGCASERLKLEPFCVGCFPENFQLFHRIHLGPRRYENISKKEAENHFDCLQFDDPALFITKYALVCIDKTEAHSMCSLIVFHIFQFFFQSTRELIKKAKKSDEVKSYQKLLIFSEVKAKNYKSWNALGSINKISKYAITWRGKNVSRDQSWCCSIKSTWFPECKQTTTRAKKKKKVRQ